MLNGIRAGCILVAMLLSLPVLAADWLVAAQNTAIVADQPLIFEIIKPDAADWPDSLTLDLDSAATTESIALRRDDAKMEEGGSNRRRYVWHGNRRHKGVVTARLHGLSSNPVLLLADETADGSAAAQEASAAPVIVLPRPEETPALSSHEPTYFVVGRSAARGTDARFQISFKYRLFDPEGAIGRFSPLLSNLYFSYTQTSLWDLSEDSSPFRDTSYRPGLFYDWTSDDRPLMPNGWRAGLEHESNGRSGDESRSINMAYLMPSWHLELDSGRRLSLMPRFNYYLEKHENRDIQRYRGYVDWTARYGREDGLIASVLYRQGTGGYATGQLDLTYPISERIFARTGSFLHLQLFSGYGETLLDYDRRRDTQLRLGISLAR